MADKILLISAGITWIIILIVSFNRDQYGQ